MSEASARWRSKAEQAEQLCRDLFDNAPVGYVRTDLDGTVLMVNDTARQALGLRQDVAGKPLAAMAGPASRQVVRRLAVTVATEPDGAEAEVELGGAGMAPALFRVQVRPEPGAAALATLRWTLHDLTQQHRSAELIDDLRRRLALAIEQDDEAGRLTVALDRLGELLLEDPRGGRAVHEVLESVRILTPTAGSVCLLTADHELTSLGLPSGGAAGRRELTLGDGPALRALREGERQASRDLRIDPRWPGLAATARTVGIAAALAVPVRVSSRTLGVLVVYAEHSGAFDDATVRALEAVAHRVGIVLANLERYAHAVTLADQLTDAMDSRGTIEQAKGILMERLGLDADQAFAQLRRSSQHQHRKLHEVAAEVVAAAVTRQPSQRHTSPD